MLNWQRPKAATQLATYLRGELAQGRWADRMPGVIRLAEELGTARNTVEAALKLLEQEGYLIPQGHGKGRLIRQKLVQSRKKSRVAILVFDSAVQTDQPIVELQNFLQNAGFATVLSERRTNETRLDPGRMRRIVQRTDAAAWILVAAPREILEWFLAEGIPVYAFFGRRRELAIAGGGPDKSEAYRELVRELVRRGHRRIVLLTMQARRLPMPGRPERSFLAELEASGLATSSYNLPDWEPTPDGLIKYLNEVWRLTPPTAFLIDEAYLFHAIKHQLSARGIRCPEDVSLICSDPDPAFSWFKPSIAHIGWDVRPLLHHVLRWAKSVREGKERRDQIEVPAELVLGETLGRAGW